MSDLESSIAAGEIAPVYVLSGADLLVARVVAALTEAVVTPATRAFNLDLLEAKGAGPTAILNAARTLPMMGKRRLVVVRDTETLAADGLAQLAAYLDAPSPDSVVVFTCGKVDGRLKFFATAKKKGVLHDLAVPRQLGAWIAAEAKRHKANLPGDAARRLEEVVGRDLSRLASAIEQLALYAGEGKAITVDDVDALVADTSEKTVFQLSDAVGQGDRAGALRAVAKLVEQRESAVGVTMMLARHVRQLALYKELAAAGAPPGEIARVVGAPPFVIDRSLAPQSRRFTPAALARAVQLLAKADRDLKGPVKQALGERIVLERLVGELVRLAR